MESLRKKKRRPPRRAVKRTTAAELMQEAEFRRWRFHAPGSLKRQAYELINTMAKKRGEPSGKWTERV